MARRASKSGRKYRRTTLGRRVSTSRLNWPSKSILQIEVVTGIWNPNSKLKIETRNWNPKSKLEIEIQNRNQKCQVSISNIVFEFIVSISGFNFEFRFQFRISSFDLELGLVLMHWPFGPVGSWYTLGQFSFDLQVLRASLVCNFLHFGRWPVLKIFDFWPLVTRRDLRLLIENGLYDHIFVSFGRF